jgi:hypothetical protein
MEVKVIPTAKCMDRDLNFRFVILKGRCNAKIRESLYVTISEEDRQGGGRRILTKEKTDRDVAAKR